MVSPMSACGERPKIQLVGLAACRTSSSCHAKHLFVFFYIFLLVCFQWLSTLLPLMCVILVVYC